MSALYLTRIVLDPRDQLVQRDLADCQHLHRSVMRLFPDIDTSTPRDAFGVLHRAEADERTGEIVLLVQSNREPDPTTGTARLGFNASLLWPMNCFQTKDVSHSFAAIEQGMRLRFRLRANPVKRRSGRADDRLAGKRVALLKEDEQLAWMARKAADAGVALLECQVQADPLGAFVKGGRRGKEAMRFQAVRYNGVLRVDDVDLLLKALTEGIGPAKAYGFGLLSVARAGR